MNPFLKINYPPLIALLWVTIISSASVLSGCVTTTPAHNTSIILPQYRDISKSSDIALYATEQEYESARADSDFAFERISYRVGNNELVAFLYHRANYTGPRPTIVFNRGSYIRNNAAPEYLTMFNRLAKSGYTVIAPMYRGSEGTMGHDEMGARI